MAKAFLTLLSIYIISFQPLAAQTCPKIVVVPDLLEVGLGKPANFTVFASTYPKGWQSLENNTLNWVVSSGTIEAGQGTNTITVNTTGLALNSSLTVSVDVGGLPLSCESFISSTVTIKDQNNISNWYTIKVCMLENGKPVEQTCYYNPTYGDTLVLKDNKRMLFCEAYKNATAGYAASKPWYINSETITYNKVKFVKYGLPRILGVNEIKNAGSYEGVPVFIEATLTGTPEVIYIPVRPGCEFQPYQKQIN